MSQVKRTANGLEAHFHPVSHYNSPDDVLNDIRLSTDEKRVILSSWASDMYGVESKPTLREVPGIPNRLCLDDILAALKRLDDENDPPPRGGLAMRRQGSTRFWPWPGITIRPGILICAKRRWTRLNPLCRAFKPARPARRRRRG